MIVIAKWIIIAFGIFFIYAGLFMLIAPEKVRLTIRRAGSTPVINYGEITLRMIPAWAMVLYAKFSLFPVLFSFFGWFMLVTSFVLYFVPRRLHHQFSNKCADRLQSGYFRYIAPFAILIGLGIIYSVA